MERHIAVSTIFDIQTLREKLNLLKTRYEHVSQSLQDKRASRDLQSIRRLERDFLFQDIRQLEKQLRKAEASGMHAFRSYFHIKRRIA